MHLSCIYNANLRASLSQDLNRGSFEFIKSLMPVSTWGVENTPTCRTTVETKWTGLLSFTNRCWLHSRKLCKLNFTPTQIHVTYITDHNRAKSEPPSQPDNFNAENNTSLLKFIRIRNSPIYKCALVFVQDRSLCLSGMPRTNKAQYAPAGDISCKNDSWIVAFR